MDTTALRLAAQAAGRFASAAFIRLDQIEQFSLFARASRRYNALRSYDSWRGDTCHCPFKMKAALEVLQMAASVPNSPQHLVALEMTAEWASKFALSALLEVDHDDGHATYARAHTRYDEQWIGNSLVRDWGVTDPVDTNILDGNAVLEALRPFTE